MKIMASNAAQHNQLLSLFAIYAKKLDKLYDDFITRLISSLPYSEREIWEKLAQDPLFRFDELPYMSARLQHIFNDFVNNQVLCYKAGITDGVALAYSQDDVNLGKYTILQDSAIDAARAAAVTSFISNRMSREEGLSLSDKVWNYAQLGKTEIEMGISNVIKDGLKAGTSAEELGRKVRQYLNNPTMMYRRYWVNVALAGGGKKKVAKWYRRHIDEKTGKVTFKQEPLEKVGRGVYRSARMNGYRLMRTEINMSYHKANASRWAKEPFVYGIRVWRSPQHPEEDICDELEGYYPKDFVFSGWHPNCMCASAPLTIYGDEKRDFYRRLMKGEDMSNFHSKNEITKENMNANWWKYVEDNHDAILKAAERGKLAYHLRDNQSYWIDKFTDEERKKIGLTPLSDKERIKQIAAARHAVRTSEQAKDIADRWHKHKQVDALIRQATPLIAELKEYPTVARWRVLQNAVDDRNASAIEKMLSDKLIAKKLLYEKIITPKELVWSNYIKNFITEGTATQVHNMLIRTVKEAREKKTLVDALDYLRNTASRRIESGLFGKELDAYKLLLQREERRMKDFFNFNEYKGEIETGLDYLKKNIIVVGGGAAKVPNINVSSFFLDDVNHMKTLSDNISVMVSNLKALDDTAVFVATAKSTTVHQLWDGIRYALQKDGLMADVDDMIAKLNRNIERLKKEAAKAAERKAEKETIAKVSNIRDIEDELNKATKGIRQDSDILSYYYRLFDTLEKNLTYRNGLLPKALEERKKLVTGALKAGVSDSMIMRYYERYKHGIAVLEAYDRQVQNGLRTSLDNVLERLGKQGAKYLEVKKLDKKYSTEEIIKRLCGGDETQGSCSSLAYAYAANKNGYDVLDFRGGRSQLFFSSNNNIGEITRNCRGIVISEYDDYKAAKKLLKEVKEGKEYYLATGRHAAIVRKAESGYEYLELQSGITNGFRPLTQERLKNRFGCQHQHTTQGYKFTTNSELIDIEELGKDKSFKEIMGYINTAVDKQHKGAYGSIK